jgi:hypothetical protein
MRENEHIFYLSVQPENRRISSTLLMSSWGDGKHRTTHFTSHFKVSQSLVDINILKYQDETVLLFANDFVINIKVQNIKRLKCY